MERNILGMLLVVAMLAGSASAIGVWEENMDVDPTIGGDWNLRIGAYDMTATPGLMTVGAGAWACVMD